MEKSEKLNGTHTEVQRGSDEHTAQGESAAQVLLEAADLLKQTAGEVVEGGFFILEMKLHVVRAADVETAVQDEEIPDFMSHKREVTFAPDIIVKRAKLLDTLEKLGLN